MSGIGFAAWFISGLKSEIKLLRAEISKVEATTNEKIERVVATTAEQVNRVEATSAEQVYRVEATTLSRIATSKSESILESTNNFMKYNHSQEYVSLRQSK